MTKATSNSTPAPLVIESTNLSEAWARIIVHILENPGTEITPLVLSLSGFDKNGVLPEDTNLRLALDELLNKKGKMSIENVAFTIFPQRYWQIAAGNRSRLFELYSNSFGRIKAHNRQLNSRGLYFQRMTMYGRGPCDGNQLEWIISQFNSRTGVRRSMFQATVFDAGRDHVASAQLGFPCLQHVSFVPTSTGLVLNAFYATQQIFDKAYGNYLGLAHLGNFMAKELGTSLARINITIGVVKLERITKNDPELSQVIMVAKSLVNLGKVTQTEAA